MMNKRPAHSDDLHYEDEWYGVFVKEHDWAYFRAELDADRLADQMRERHPGWLIEVKKRYGQFRPLGDSRS